MWLHMRVCGNTINIPQIPKVRGRHSEVICRRSVVRVEMLNPAVSACEVMISTRANFPWLLSERKLQTGPIVCALVSWRHMAAKLFLALPRENWPGCLDSDARAAAALFAATTFNLSIPKDNLATRYCKGLRADQYWYPRGEGVAKRNASLPSIHSWEICSFKLCWWISSVIFSSYCGEWIIVTNKGFWKFQHILQNTNDCCQCSYYERSSRAGQLKIWCLELRFILDRDQPKSSWEPKPINFKSPI